MRDHDVADAEIRIDITGDSAEDDGPHIEPVESELGVHGGIDHTDPAQSPTGGGT